MQLTALEIVGGALIVIGIVVLLVLGARRSKRESALKIKQPRPPQRPWSRSTGAG